MTLIGLARQTKKSEKCAQGNSPCIALRQKMFFECRIPPASGKDVLLLRGKFCSATLNVRSASPNLHSTSLNVCLTS